MNNGRLFFEAYVSRLNQVTVVEIGSQDVNGSLREVCPNNAKYIGLDFQEAKGVDVLLTDPYSLPFDDESVDVVVSSSCLEHSEMFWLVFTEVLRILKPDGLLYLNVPSNGPFHRYPVDCWRFYPDAGDALVTWGKHCGFRPALLESYTAPQDADVWNDFVAVFVKDDRQAVLHPRRISTQHTGLDNIKRLGDAGIFNKAAVPQDLRRVNELEALLSKERQSAAEQAEHLAEDKNQMKLTLDQAAKEAKAELGRVQGQLSQALTENARLTEQVAKFQRSRSWKLTAPLRALKRRISGN